MNENQRILLWRAHQGTAYQCAGALQRLGRQMMAYVEEINDLTKLRHIPMESLSPGEEAFELKVKSLSWVLVCAEPFLAQNKNPDSEFWEDLNALKQKIQILQKNLKWILILPQNTDPNQIDSFINRSHSNVKVILVPSVFGFRDNALLDSSVDALNSGKIYLFKTKNDDRAIKTEYLFAGDVASYVSSLLNTDSDNTQKIWATGVELTLDEWKNSFAKYFLSQKKSFRFNLKNLIHRPKNQDYWKGVWGKNNELESNQQYLQASKIFPVSPQKIDRAINTCFSAFQKGPDVELVYPPGRSP